MAVDDLKFAAIFMSDRRGHFQILLRRAVPHFLFLRTDLNIKTIGVESELGELVHHNTAVNTS
jgi:hypothetical protein